jgi:hypothetical protein
LVAFGKDTNAPLVVGRDEEPTTLVASAYIVDLSGCQHPCLPLAIEMSYLGPQSLLARQLSWHLRHLYRSKYNG